MKLSDQILQIGNNAVEAARAMTKLTERKKNCILSAMAEALDENRAEIVKANQLDLDNARNNGTSLAMLDRLELTDKRISGMINGLHNVAALKDPVGEVVSRWIRPNGLEIVRTRVPIGVIGIIYESRPNVTADATALCLKTSNAVILRGGSEAFNSNLAIAQIMQNGGAKHGLPANSIQLITTTDRKAVKYLVQLEGKVDLIIPRGGEGLIRTVTELSHIPVIKHYKGICHTYIDKDADLDMALEISDNAKCQRPGVCNAMETLLVHNDIAADFLPKLAIRLQEKGVELRGDEQAQDLLPSIKPANEKDWHTEYLDLILSIRIVPDLQVAIDHINNYGSQHSDAIITNAETAQKTFLRDVDSSTVYVNASTRFTDGGEFGMGAEIGISTDKLHARGPMGLEELTTYKYVVYGDGQIRE